jgi:hypothetical protein
LRQQPLSLLVKLPSLLALFLLLQHRNVCSSLSYFGASARQEASAQDRPNRILLGLRKTDEGDEEHLRRFSEILLDLEKGEWTFNPAPNISYRHQLPSIENTFDALHQRLLFKWNDDEKYDTVNLFGETEFHVMQAYKDMRQGQYRALWIFDTHNNVLRYTSANRCSQIPLSLLRERAVSVDAAFRLSNVGDRKTD